MNDRNDIDRQTAESYNNKKQEDITPSDEAVSALLHNSSYFPFDVEHPLKKSTTWKAANADLLLLLLFLVLDANFLHSSLLLESPPFLS